MPYEKMQKECIYGHYDTSHHAAYTVTAGEKLRGPWYYVYNNRKVLLYVDQNGPVKIQYQPPNGILIFKRELGETQSKWQVWVQSEDLNEGVPVSNFNSPIMRHDLKKTKFYSNWTPEKATYTAEYDNADIITEIFVPCDKATVCMKTTIKNKGNKQSTYNVTPAVFPYVNIPQMVAWDLPEWYLSTKVMSKGEMVTIHGQMNDPHMCADANRSVTFNIDYEEDAEFELDLSKFQGTGNFLSPDIVRENYEMSYKMKDAEGKSFGSYQAVWAARYKAVLNPGESKTFTQVLTIQEAYNYNDSENEYERIYFDKEKYEACYQNTYNFYDRLFNVRTIKTENELYNNFLNEFTPLQMFWVCSLDRGWPSSMRGIRDASQDFTGMAPIDPVWTRETILAMFEHQQTDGWMPRQISTVSRQAPHDMRYYCDGGAFLLELITEYMALTRDFDFLNEKIYWLDSDEKSTVLEHIKRTVDFYLADKNIGEHNICKVWYGDWWDPMDKIGMEGRGESVTVTAQMSLNLKKLAQMYRWLNKKGIVDDSYLELADKYLKYRDMFIEGLQKHAYNSLGYFNGFFNDNGKWLLSDNDPDGESRMYMVSNMWALIGECADEEMRKSVLDNVKKLLKCEFGYYTASKGYPTHIDKAGRVGNGTSPSAGLYNHAQSFMVRACCECGDAELAYDATRHILPLEQEYIPVEKTYAPAYALANKYSASPKSPYRVQLQFLSGTVSYALRIVYNFFAGIRYDFEGLTMKPCVPKDFGNFTVTFEYLGNKFTVNYTKTENAEKTFKLNGQKIETEIDSMSKLPKAFIPDEQMQKQNIIEIEY